MRFERSIPPNPAISPRPTTKAKGRKGSWLQTLLLIGFVICVALSALALFALWWLTDSPTASEVDEPLAIVQPAIVPSLALMELAGDPPGALAYQALQAAQLETSRALTVYGLALMPASRIGLTMQLAQRLQASDNLDGARHLYRQTRALAVLDTNLDPLARGEALIQATKGFIALNQLAEARETAEQVQLIARQTPDLLPVQRSQLVRDLLAIITPLADELLTQGLQELARSPYLSPQGLLLTAATPLVAQPPALTPELTTATFRRQQLARQLAEFLIQGPLDQAGPLLQPLQEALRAEDQLRTAYFTQLSTNPDLTLSLQFWLLTQQQEWLTDKLAVAKGAFGVSLMPDWETNLVAISQELATTVANLHNVRLQFAQAESEPVAQFAGRISAHQWLALQVELGFYPQTAAAEIGEQLRVAQAELAQNGLGAALPIIYKMDATSPGFRIGPTSQP